MGTRRVQKQLTPAQVKTIRANAARRLSQGLDRAGKFMLAEQDSKGNDITMTAGQLKALQILRDTCLPTMQSVAWTDETPDTKTPEQMEAARAQALEALSQSLSKEQLQAMLDSRDKETQ